MSFIYYSVMTIDTVIIVTGTSVCNTSLDRRNLNGYIIHPNNYRWG